MSGLFGPAIDQWGNSVIYQVRMCIVCKLDIQIYNNFCNTRNYTDIKP